MRTIMFGVAAMWAGLASSEAVFAQTAAPPPLSEGCTFRLTSEVAGAPGLYIPDSPGDVKGGPTWPSGALRLVKHLPAATSSGTTVRSGDQVYIRTTTGANQWIYVPNASEDSIDVRAEQGGAIGSVTKLSIMEIRKVSAASPLTYAPAGDSIHLDDLVILRDTGAAGGPDRWFRLDNSNSEVQGVNDEKNATAFRISALDSPPCPTGDFITMSVKIDQARNPKNLGDIARECRNNAQCVTFLSAISAYTGVSIDSIVGVAAEVIPGSGGPQDYNFGILLPKGYRVCHAVASVFNLTPGSGSNAPLISVSAWHEGDPERNGLGVYMVLPQTGLGGAGTWVEAILTLIGVSEAHLMDAVKAEACNNLDSPVEFLRCKGNPCPEQKYGGFGMHCSAS